MRNFAKRNGFSFFDVSFIVIVTAIVAAIAVPSLVSSRQAANESAALGTLRQVQTAQVGYRLKFGAGKSYASFDQLRAAGLLDAKFTGSKNNYAFDGSLTADGSGYCMRAAPASSDEMKYFGLSNRGIVYESAVADEITCADGVLTTGGGAQMVQR
jgi:type II secretory pathway pseudopilin PulG